MARSGTIRVGIGGWVFPPWRGVFYPAGFKQANELEYASTKVTTIEINSTFYRAQAPTSYRKWHQATPDNFVFSLKAPRVTTHRRVLAEADPSIQRFLASGIVELGDKLGPILWQFPPYKKFDAEDFAKFLSFLPPETGGRRLRHAVEVRHESFLTPAFVDLLREHGVAVAFIDSDKHPPIQDVTADFIYARLERTQDKVPTGYNAKDIETWTARFGDWAAGGAPKDAVHLHSKPAAKKPRDCFVYFISGAKVRNPAAAQAMLKVLA
jgi:uncharacterized protein YecE (DUF72 family)